MINYIRLGKKIYNTKNTSETRRMLVFIVRCLLNTGRMNRLHRFFMKDDVRRRIAAEYPFVYEQPTRAFFYNQSTFDERARLVEQHMEYLEKHIKEDVFLGLYSGKRYVLWESSGEIGHLRFELSYHPGQRKEGILSVVMRLDEDDLYQMMFWIAPDQSRRMGALDRRHAGTEYGKCQGCGEEGYETLLFLPHEEFHPPCDPGSGQSPWAYTYLCGHKLWLLCE